MLRTLLLVFVLGLVAADGASAQNKTVYGWGMGSCGKWQQYRIARSTGSLQLEAYVDGFLSGYNAASDSPDFLAGKPDDAALYNWIDNYCRDKPLNLIGEAVVALKEELLSRAP